MTETATAAGPRVAHDPTLGFRRTVAAIALPTAFAAQAASNTIYAVATSDGLADDTGVNTLLLFGRDPGAMELATALALFGALLAVPGVAAAMRVLRPARPRLSLIAGMLMIAGYVAYFGIAANNLLAIQLAVGGVDAAGALDAAQSMPTAIPMFLLFVIGNLVGTALLGIATILSKSVPWWAGAAILGWPVGHITNLVVGSEWFAVAGGVLEVIGLSVLTAAALRTSNAEWASRG